MNEDKKDKDIKDSLIETSRYNPALFHYDLDLYVTYRRIENINAALFLITTSISDSDVLKNSLRTHSLKTLSTITSFIKNPNIDFNDIRQISANVLELTSLISAGLWSGIISDMNANILLKEISKVHDSISNYIHKHERNIVLDAALFREVDLELYHRKTAESAATTPQQSPLRTQPKPRSDTRPVNTIPSYNNVSERGSEITPEKRTERRQTILNLLKDRSNLNIKDFIAVVPEYSEKTIQRELLSLVEEGLIKKEGERRWSTYSLNK